MIEMFLIFGAGIALGALLTTLFVEWRIDDARKRLGHLNIVLEDMLDTLKKSKERK